MTRHTPAPTSMDWFETMSDLTNAADERFPTEDPYRIIICQAQAILETTTPKALAVMGAAPEMLLALRKAEPALSDVVAATLFPLDDMSDRRGLDAVQTALAKLQSQ